MSMHNICIVLYIYIYIYIYNSDAHIIFRYNTHPRTCTHACTHAHAHAHAHKLTLCARPPAVMVANIKVAITSRINIVSLPRM